IVDTVAVGAVLMAGRNSEEARRVARHTPALLAAIGTLAADFSASGRHPSWRDVNLGTVLPHWSRAEAAEQWLTQAFAQRKLKLKEASPPSKEASAAPRVLKRVKSTAVSAPTERKKLFDEFDAW